MSEIKVNSIKGVGASAAAITVNNTDGTCTANLTNRTNKNLVINGAMQVAQRGTTGSAASSNNNYGTVDRFRLDWNNLSVNATESQGSLGSSDTPFTLGFRKYYRLTLASAGTANNNAYIQVKYVAEAQDLATSGWNYTSSSSNITLQFWVRCSTNQTFYANILCQSGVGGTKDYVFSFTASGNDTWTKITHTIPGDSNLIFNYDTAGGLIIRIIPFFGTNLTNNRTLNQWATHNAGDYVPNMASTWLTAGASTFDVTGVQLEVGSVATDFEHRSFAQELALCQRYYFKVGYGTQYVSVLVGIMASSTDFRCTGRWPVPMRVAPTITQSGLEVDSETAASVAITGLTSSYLDPYSGRLQFSTNSASFGAGQAAQAYTSNTTSFLAGSAEL